MSDLLLAVGAQLEAEVRTRLRSPGTLVALGIILVGSTLWMPEPRGKIVSLSWRLAGDVTYTPVYSAAYVGVATAIFTTIFILFVAFYLVAGSVRRDRETGVGAILAATPLGKGAYLAGKLVASAAYLGLIAVLILAVGVAKLLAWGEGPLEMAPFFVPWLVVTVPGVLVVAASAIFFDVTPGLRGRAGLVIWFFGSTIVLAVLPDLLARGQRLTSLAFIDPCGLATLNRLIERSLPSGARDVSMGLIVSDTPPVRAPWAGIEFPAGVLAARVASPLWAAVPFLLAVYLFDRFDPARRLFRRLGPKRVAAPTAPAIALPLNGALPVPAVAVVRLTSLIARPGLLAAIVAEARLLWDGAPLLRWALLAASVAGALLPGEASSGAAAIFLVLLVPVIAEAGAREVLAGAEALVFSQPSVPRSPAIWKTSSLSLFLLAISAPLVARAALTSASHLTALVTGLFFVAAFAAGAALLTGGGKLFSGLYLALWYAAANKLPAADFCGTFGGGLGLWTRCGYVLVGVAFVAVAMLVEMRRRAGWS